MAIPAHPHFLYGTAWKEQETRGLVTLALRSGFRGIDTANQRKHYHELGVGEGIADALDAGVTTRDALFLQTKFTFVGGQDARLPYDPHASVAEQVAQSFASSLAHLRTTWLDSFVLHGPSQANGLGADDHEAWRAMEKLVDAGSARAIGISNVSARQLAALLTFARVRPSFVQNRCHASTRWDADVRALCTTHEVRYQAFSLLTANRDVLAREHVTRIAQQAQRTPAQVIFRFALARGMLPLTGTSSGEHMRSDLDIGDFSLSEAELKTIETGDR